LWLHKIATIYLCNQFCFNIEWGTCVLTKKKFLWHCLHIAFALPFIVSCGYNLHKGVLCLKHGLSLNFFLNWTLQFLGLLQKTFCSQISTFTL
jgi:hypothetical protein